MELVVDPFDQEGGHLCRSGAAPLALALSGFGTKRAAPGRVRLCGAVSKPLGALGQPHAGSAARGRRPLLCVKPLFAPSPRTLLKHVHSSPRDRSRDGPRRYRSLQSRGRGKKTRWHCLLRGGRGARRIAHKRGPQTRACSVSIAANITETLWRRLPHSLWAQCSSEQCAAHSHTRATRRE